MMEEWKSYGRAWGGPVRGKNEGWVAGRFVSWQVGLLSLRAYILASWGAAVLRPYITGVEHRVQPIANYRSAGGGEAFHQVLFALEEYAKVGACGVGFDAALDFGQFAFGASLLQGDDAAFSFFPGEFAGILEEDFEKDPAIAVFKLGADFGGWARLAGQRGSHQRSENFLGLKADVKLALIEPVREFEAEALGFSEHSNQATLDGLCGAADKFGFEFYLVAALGGGFVEFGAADGFVEAHVLRDASRPLGTQEAIWNFLNVGQEEIYGVALPFPGGEIHAARAGDEVIDILRRLFPQ